MAMIDRSFPVIAIVPEAPSGVALASVVDRLQELGTDILVVGDPVIAARARVGLPLIGLGAEALTPILTILPLQQLAWSLARERGGDPDQPRGLKKVTETW